MPDTVNTASAFTIAEATGQRRTLRLVGRALPYQPFELESTQRVEVEWLPGSPDGVATVLGAGVEPTKVNGSWKDKYLGDTATVSGATSDANDAAPATVDGRRVATADDLCLLCQSLAEEGQEVVVSWHSRQRRGHIKRFRESWRNAHDCEWEMEFVWTSKSEPTGNPVFTSEASTVDAAAVLQAQVNRVHDAAPPPFPAADGLLDGLRDGLATLDRAVDSIQGAVAGVERAASAPADAIRRAVSAASSLAAGAQTLLDLTIAQPAAAMRGDAAPGDVGFGDTLAVNAYLAELRAALRALKRTATIRAQELGQQIASDLLGVYTAREGEDLRDVARKFYGSALQWRGLMTFNGLTDAALVRGQVVLVPRLPAGGSA